MFNIFLLDFDAFCHLHPVKSNETGRGMGKAIVQALKCLQIGYGDVTVLRDAYLRRD